MKVDYGKTVEETVLEVEAGNVGEEVTVTVAGKNATGDIWKYLTEVKLTYPDGTKKNVLPDGQESFSEKIGYEISGKDLILGKDLFTQPGKYQIAVTAEYYGTKTVEFTVVDGTSTETKPVPEYKGVTCEKRTSYEVLVYNRESYFFVHNILSYFKFTNNIPLKIIILHIITVFICKSHRVCSGIAQS